jgi:hypothetical protein
VGVVRLLLAGGLALGEDGAELGGGVALSGFGLGGGLFEALGDGCLVSLEPFCLGFEEHEGAGDDLSRVAVVAEFDLALDALFGYGIEGEVHVGSITVEFFARWTSRG